MSDQKRWFKVWTSILSDPCFSCLPPDDVGRWVRLGASIALNGNNGSIVGTAEFFSKLLNCQNDIEKVINRLPNVSIKIDENRNGKFAVTMLNWNKYQLDSTGYERQKKFRNAKSVTVQDKIREEKIREEKENKRKEHKPTSFRTPTSDNDFLEALSKNPAYHGIDITNELHKMDAWLLLPKNKGRKKTYKFILNWLNKAEKTLPIAMKKPQIYVPPAEPQEKINPQELQDLLRTVSKKIGT